MIHSILATLGNDGQNQQQMDENNQTMPPIPVVRQDQLCWGAQLGRGGFSDVFAVQISDLEILDGNDNKNNNNKPRLIFQGISSMYAEESDDETSSVTTTTATTTTSGCTSSSATNSLSSRLALKRIRDDLVGTSAGHAAAEDLQTEVELLSTLPQHANIIRLIAISENFNEQQQHDASKKFMILEQVTETLENRLRRWATKERLGAKYGNNNMGVGGSVPSWMTPQGREVKRLRLEQQQRRRLQSTVVGISRALAFLHQHNIIFRDLKPQNVGFGFVDDEVKLFDFGLAEKLEASNGKCYGCAGTVRYMAPEVVEKGSCTLAADVYSLSHLIWEVCTLKKPYGAICRVEQLQKFTCQRHGRPPVNKIASPRIRALVTEGWQAEPMERPTMEVFCQRLESECCKAQGMDL